MKTKYKNPSPTTIPFNYILLEKAVFLLSHMCFLSTESMELDDL